MIRFLSNVPDWNPIWKIKAKERLVVDLGECRDQQGIVRELVTLLKGRDSPKIVGGNSLDALVDVMGDWFIEHWGETIEIYIRGADAIKRCDPALLPLIADCMQSAFDSGARNAHLVGRDTPYEEAKKRVTIFFCWPGEAPRRNRVLSGIARDS
jgi:hypothetical protein